MFQRVRRWLLHRHRPQATISGITRGSSAYLFTTSRRDAAIAQDIADDPAMCEPLISKPTARITRVIDDGETMADWDDESRTWTMETVAVRV